MPTTNAAAALSRESKDERDTGGARIGGVPGQKRRASRMDEAIGWSRPPRRLNPRRVARLPGPRDPATGAVTGILAAVPAANLGLIVLEVVRIGERPVTVPSTAIAAVEH